MDFRFLKAAEDEMFAAADIYDRDRAGLGDEFLALVENTVAELMTSPLRWPLIDARHRRRVMRRFPFGIVYRVMLDAVVIVAVAHHKRAPYYWRSR